MSKSQINFNSGGPSGGGGQSSARGKTVTTTESSERLLIRELMNPSDPGHSYAALAESRASLRSQKDRLSFDTDKWQVNSAVLAAANKQGSNTG